MIAGHAGRKRLSMNKIDWKAKLTSRKFWAAVVSFVTLLILAFGGKQATATQVAEIIMAGASVVAYIIGEGLVDAANASNSTTTNIVPPYTGSVVGTVTDAPAAAVTSTGTAEASQTQQVTAGLSSDTTVK